MSTATEQQTEEKVCQLCGVRIPKAWHIAYRAKDRVVDLHAWCVTRFEKTQKH